VVPLTGQERAWTSPVWYTPSAEARKAAPAGMTVTELKKKGATALNDAQLKALLVGKAVWMRNNVTAHEFSQSFTAEGNVTLFHAGKYTNMPSGFGNVVRDGFEGTTIPYKIADGKVVTNISQDPYAYTFFKLGDTVHVARSNEFGFANYQIIAPPQITVNPLVGMGVQFATDLGLTEQQSRQILPILNDEIKQLGALKKDTKLSGLQKAEALRKIGVSFDEKISPLLNPEQQKKFQGWRDQMRLRIIESMGSEVLEKLRSAESAAFTDARALKR
jgi:hypothetical protein